jgi:hypothetical protein
MNPQQYFFDFVPRSISTSIDLIRPQSSASVKYVAIAAPSGTMFDNEYYLMGAV